MRAVAEGLDVEFRLGEAEDLPVADESFDAALSVFGTMFAPDHSGPQTRSSGSPAGGTVGLASWTPDGFIGQMFRVITWHVPGPAGVASPLLWGTDSTCPASSARPSPTPVRASAPAPSVSPPPEEFVAFFRRWYGPTLKAFEAARR